MTVYYTAIFKDVNNNTYKTFTDYTLIELKKEVIKNLDGCCWGDKDEVDLRSPISMFKYLATKEIKDVHVASIVSDSTKTGFLNKLVYFKM